MTVDWFLVDAPGVVPDEFEAWRSAMARHHKVVLRCLDTKVGSAERDQLNAEGLALRLEVDQLERRAREAWLGKLEGHGDHANPGK